eukprot:2466484-Rhodomonas_salina.1
MEPRIAACEYAGKKPSHTALRKQVRSTSSTAVQKRSTHCTSSANELMVRILPTTSPTIVPASSPSIPASAPRKPSDLAISSASPETRMGTQAMATRAMAQCPYTKAKVSARTR